MINSLNYFILVLKEILTLTVLLSKLKFLSVIIIDITGINTDKTGRSFLVHFLCLSCKKGIKPDLEPLGHRRFSVFADEIS